MTQFPRSPSIRSQPALKETQHGGKAWRGGNTVHLMEARKLGEKRGVEEGDVPFQATPLVNCLLQSGPNSQHLTLNFYGFISVLITDVLSTHDSPKF